MHYLFHNSLSAVAHATPFSDLFFAHFKDYFFLFLHKCDFEQMNVCVLAKTQYMNVMSLFFILPSDGLVHHRGLTPRYPVFVTCKCQDSPVVLSLVSKATAATPVCVRVCVCFSVYLSVSL